MVWKQQQKKVLFHAEHDKISCIGIILYVCLWQRNGDWQMYFRVLNQLFIIVNKYRYQILSIAQHQLNYEIECSHQVRDANMNINVHRQDHRVWIGKQ